MRKEMISAIFACLALNACQYAPPHPERIEAVDTSSHQKQAKLVIDQDAYNEAAKDAQPGDLIVLQNGVWRDFDMLLDAEGTAQAPIRVIAETPGKVILSGQSSLRLAGRHLIVSGLVFRDGYTPRPEVISFRRDSDHLAFDSIVSNTVIEDYSNPERTQVDLWVAMYGRNNTFEHNHLVGKLNAGPTMAVRLDTEDSRDNGHIIRYNYFGPRPLFGSNGGETLRIGTSPYSLFRSGTLVEHNYFDRCSGEVEIISNKSGGNTYRGNTFFRSQGTLTLRHGNDAIVEDNLFDGDGAPYTGGVRVINAHQIIRHNYFRNLSGERFSGALVIMNGVPNSPINRYHQVDGAIIENNVFDTVHRIELAEGADAERSAPPVNSSFRGNVVIGTDGNTPFRIKDNVSGIRFQDNVTNVVPPADIRAGFDVTSLEAARAHLSGPDTFGVKKNETGVTWHPKASIGSPFDGGKRFEVLARPDALAKALLAAGPGDTLVLGAGRFTESMLVNLKVPVTIEGADPENPPLITFERPNFIVLSGEGSLRMRGIEVSGTKSPDAAGNSFITTSANGGGSNHTVELTEMSFNGFDVNKGFSVISASKGTFYDLIDIAGSKFEDVSGSVVKLNSETDDFGIYNAEYVVIEDSDFMRIGGPVASVYRGGRDESTFGPHVWVRGSRFDGIGLRGGPFMELFGVQNLELTDNQIADARPAMLTITTGDPTVLLSGNSLTGQNIPAVLTTVDLR